ncbi:hypothetical protein NEFER03_1040 [Nematocida sp. LUAm3]|nr:hypothetical protein NEFER03_1040 [Nematocida sp. LUAm3]KAI5175356.1 hypothetical protein NEFER02_1285 [Nematocida sp. LUAm2]KAI5177687.1 hypothetical protein NEFER01_0911 [Nematocida sp. LUAm1]
MKNQAACRSLIIYLLICVVFCSECSNDSDHSYLQPSRQPKKALPQLESFESMGDPPETFVEQLSIEENFPIPKRVSKQRDSKIRELLGFSQPKLFSLDDINKIITKGFNEGKLTTNPAIQANEIMNILQGAKNQINSSSGMEEVIQMIYVCASFLERKIPLITYLFTRAQKEMNRTITVPCFEVLHDILWKEKNQHFEIEELQPDIKKYSPEVTVSIAQNLLQLLYRSTSFSCSGKKRLISQKYLVYMECLYRGSEIVCIDLNVRNRYLFPHLLYLHNIMMYHISSFNTWLYSTQIFLFERNLIDILNNRPYLIQPEENVHSIDFYNYCSTLYVQDKSILSAFEEFVESSIFLRKDYIPDLGSRVILGDLHPLCICLSRVSLYIKSINYDQGKYYIQIYPKRKYKERPQINTSPPPSLAMLQKLCLSEKVVIYVHSIHEKAFLKVTKEFTQILNRKRKSIEICDKSVFQFKDTKVYEIASVIFYTQIENGYWVVYGLKKIQKMLLFICILCMPIFSIFVSPFAILAISFACAAVGAMKNILSAYTKRKTPHMLYTMFLMGLLFFLCLTSAGIYRDIGEKQQIMDDMALLAYFIGALLGFLSIVLSLVLQNDRQKKEIISRTCLSTLFLLFSFIYTALVCAIFYLVTYEQISLSYYRNIHYYLLLSCIFFFCGAFIRTEKTLYGKRTPLRILLSFNRCMHYLSLFLLILLIIFLIALRILLSENFFFSQNLFSYIA